MEKGFSINAVGANDTESSTKIMEHIMKKGHHKKEDKKQGNSIYAGNAGFQDRVSEKYARTQKKAIKKLLDQFAADTQIDDEMKGRSRHIEELEANSREIRDKLSSLDARRQELQESCQVEPDSQEQKDLELLQKANAANKNPFAEQLTDEEMERLNNMPPLTEYQKGMLALDDADDAEEFYHSQLEKNKKDITVEKATIEATKKALLKVHPMVDAQKEADKLMEAARKEALGMLFEEGKDKLEEDARKMQEKIEENKAEQLEEELRRAKLEEEEAQRKEREEAMQETVFSATMQAISSTQQNAEMIQSTIKNLIQDQTLLDVDLKGLRVDKQV